MAGNPSFQELVERHYAALYRFAFSLARNNAEAADLTQQTFLIWARKGHQLRNPGQAGTWLFTTLHREFLRCRRHEDKLTLSPFDEVAEEVPDLSPNAAQDLDAVFVQEAMLGLAEHYRAALSLYYLSGHTYPEIAAILDVPIGTIMSRLTRAKNELRRVLLDKQPRVPRPRPTSFNPAKPGKEDLDGHR